MITYTSPNGGRVIKAWVDGVPVESAAIDQLRNIAQLPFIHKHVAVMPDVHLGIGATVGSVISTKRAIIPAAVGVDIGCGMCAVKLNITAAELPDSLVGVRDAIELVVPVGSAGKGPRETWGGEVPVRVEDMWFGRERDALDLSAGWARISQLHGLDRTFKRHPVDQLGTLGGGNHFIEVCLDEVGEVWVMLHSGSRGVGNKIGQTYIDIARKDMQKWMINLPDKDLAYFPEGTEHFDEYWEAVKWAQDYARVNREIMLGRVVSAIGRMLGRDVHYGGGKVVNCHHNYVDRERHFGDDVLVTRKGAIRARSGDVGIIPGSMGARSYIVIGLGNADSFNSCSHGAGRAMSRSEARRRFTEDDLITQTAGVECRVDTGVLDEIPSAYKDIDAVMAAQKDLVKIIHTLKQVVCVKG